MTSVPMYNELATTISSLVCIFTHTTNVWRLYDNGKLFGLDQTRSDLQLKIVIMANISLSHYTRYSQRFIIHNQSFYNNSTRTSRQTVLYTFLRIFRRVCIPRNVSLFAANVSISNKDTSISNPTKS